MIILEFIKITFFEVKFRKKNKRNYGCRDCQADAFGRCRLRRQLIEPGPQAFSFRFQKWEARIMPLDHSRMICLKKKLLIKMLLFFDISFLINFTRKVYKYIHISGYKCV